MDDYHGENFCSSFAAKDESIVNGALGKINPTE
jgi:hypothetical protein